MLHKQVSIYSQKLKILFLTITGILSLFLFSCTDTKRSTYFVDQNNGVIRKNIAQASTIQPNDILSITVSSLNPAATAIFNVPNINTASSTTTSGATLTAAGYLVNTDGFIQYPILGDLKVSGLTTNQLRLNLTKQLVDKDLLKDPIVTVRHLNFKVTVLGEVGRPAVINVTNEKISLLEALGLAGDITIYGQKDNVTVIRENDNGEKNFVKLNLNSKDFFASPYYYLKSNDVVYVEANSIKVKNSGRAGQILPIVFSALSVVAIIVQGIIYKR